MEQLADTSHPLVGTWKLVSFHVETEGSNEQQLWWDEHPVGFVIFTKDGRMLALLTAGDRTASHLQARWRYSVAHDGFPRPSEVCRTAYSRRIDVAEGMTANAVSTALPELT